MYSYLQGKVLEEIHSSVKHGFPFNSELGVVLGFVCVRKDLYCQSK